MCLIQLLYGAKVMSVESLYNVIQFLKEYYPYDQILTGSEPFSHMLLDTKHARSKNKNTVRKTIIFCYNCF